MWAYPGRWQSWWPRCVWSYPVSLFLLLNPAADRQSRCIIARSRQYESDLIPVNSMTKLAGETLVRAAEEQLEKLRSWAPGQQNTPRRRRIMVRFSEHDLETSKALTFQTGDSIYRYMAIISLTTEVLRIPHSDAQVQSSVRCILELCSEISQEPSNLLWPLLTAGAFAISHADRQWVRQLIDTFRSDCCRDIEIAVSVMSPIHQQENQSYTSRSYSCWSNGRGWIPKSASHLGQSLWKSWASRCA
jgi:hypothetical protein